MVDPATIMLIANLVGLGAKAKKAKEEEKYLKEQEALAKKKERRAALARATGYNDPSYYRTKDAPDTSNLDILGGVADVVGQSVGQYPDESQAFLNKLTKTKAKYPGTPGADIGWS